MYYGMETVIKNGKKKIKTQSQNCQKSVFVNKIGARVAQAIQFSE